MDLDGDGNIDILSGSYSRMGEDMAGLFQVLYGKKDGTFRKAEVLKGTDGKPLIIPASGEEKVTEKICTRPFAVDWDGDGQLDLVVGNFSGTFYWFKGEGKGKFQPTPKQIMMADGKPLKIPGVHSDPFVVDWDGDGALDIVSGSSDGGVYWARNTAGKGKPPVLQPFEALVKPAPERAYGKSLREADVTRPTYATRVWVADVNGDGKLDLLVGDSVTLVSPAKGLSDEQYKKKLEAWQDELVKLQAAMRKAVEEAGKKRKENKDKDAKAKEKDEVALDSTDTEALMKHYRKRSEFVKEEMTGFVWVYLRK